MRWKFAKCTKLQIEACRGGVYEIVCAGVRVGRSMMKGGVCALPMSERKAWVVIGMDDSIL